MADQVQIARPGAAGYTASGEAVCLDKVGEFNVAAHGLRGLASVMVLVAHIIGGTAEHIYPANEAYVSTVQHPWYFGVFGVKLFFIISGFVILPSALKYSATEYAKRRFFRIYPLFFAASLLFIVLNALTNAYPQVNNMKSIVSGLLFINLFTGTEQLAPNAWSLTYEVVFYALTCLVVYTFVKQPRPVAAAAAAALSAAFLVAFPVSIFFLAGAVIRLVGQKLINRTSILRVAEALMFCVVLYTASRNLFEYRLSDLANPAAIGALISSVAFFWLAIDPRSLTSQLLNNRVAIYLGSVSYSVYLVHPFVYFVIRAIFVRMHWFTDNVWLSIVIFGAIVSVVSLAVSHVAHIVLERWPYQWFFHQRIYRASAKAAAQMPEQSSPRLKDAGHPFRADT